MAPSRIENSAESKAASIAFTLDQLLREKAAANPNQQYLSYPRSGLDYVHYTLSDIDSFAYRAAKKYSKSTPARSKSSQPTRVVALLGASNLDYLVSVYALSKLGLTILFLSTRISDAAYKHLFQKTNCSDIIIQPAFEKTINRVRDDYPLPLNVIKMVDSSIYNPSGAQNIPAENTGFDHGFDHSLETEKPLWIIHSSGSTGLPKPVASTHRAALSTARLLSATTLNAFITLPLFHAYGVISVTGALSAGKTIAMFNADLPVTGPSIVESMTTLNTELFYAVPYALKLLAETEGGVEAMAKCHRVVFGGASCPDDLGDNLVSRGVNLVSYYGSTENGIGLSSLREEGDNEWNYLRPLPSFNKYSQWEHVTSNIYELVIKGGWPSQSLTNRPDGSYETHDLFLQHPTDPNKWKYYGRLDDTIVLSNGEKANPVTLELFVRENPYIKEGLAFGAQRPHLGMLLVPSEKAAGLSRDELVEKIWESVEAGNENMPGYAKISKEMIGFLPPGVEYPRTDKGTAIRAAYYAKYANEIDALYDAFENHAAQDGLELSEEETKQFIKKELVKILTLDDASKLQDDTDFFSLGLDSLGAMQIQGKIVRELKTGGKIGQNVVFEQPTLKKLAGYLHRLRTGESEQVDSQSELLQQLIEKYSDLPQHVPGNSKPDGDYIIVTGATGSLGAHIVAQLVAKDTVRKVYCLVRASSLEKASERTIQSLKDRHIYNTLTASQLSKIAAFPSDFSQKTLGLSSEIYEELLDNVNIVIHSAWSVNFNMDVTSFEAQHIGGSHNLMTLCLSSRRATPATFNFCSSISSVLNTDSKTIAEAEPTTFENAMPMGYARSKLVTEKVCAIAARNTTLPARVLRIGQVVGDTIHGCWNATEAIPLTIQSALTIGCLPRPVTDEIVSWLPVDIVASTIIDLSYLSAEDVARDAFFNVSHPGLTSWNNDFLPGLRAAGLKFEEVTPTEWLKRLSESNQDPAVNPPVKLLEFFGAKYGQDTVESVPYSLTDKSQKYSTSLGQCKKVDEALIGIFLKFWQEQCW
ncbi:putative NRPS-like enzyme [Morchella conica CCBAS932]|uniref:Putative NRPS-like enzyme n=1 Tax=Morchella conica CCBAS932 TaxID=1392247 RepID=A0A3N4L2C9_9PEZI|nr:putative NRPS-like enzyme [Morchella conica CCBAS932]